MQISTFNKNSNPDKKVSQETGETFTFIDMASSNPRQFGGGCRSGARAQEEDLCRRSSLSECFDLVQPPVPLYGGIFCQNVYILRDSEENDFQWYGYDDIVRANCIMVAALRKPSLDHKGKSSYFTENDYNITKFKIMSMLNILLKNEQYYLVLGALGCGAYGNPPHEVAEIFASLLKNEYRNKFHTIVFAIIDNQSTTNLNIFKDIFKKKNVELKYNEPEKEKEEDEKEEDEEEEDEYLNNLHDMDNLKKVNNANYVNYLNNSNNSNKVVVEKKVDIKSKSYQKSKLDEKKRRRDNRTKKIGGKW